jgi:hypothetical protein
MARKKGPFSKFFFSLIDSYEGVFGHSGGQRQEFLKFRNTMVGAIACNGDSTISNSLVFQGLVDRDVSTYYHQFSDSPWDHQGLSKQLLASICNHLASGEPLQLVLDDTLVKKESARKMYGAESHHDALAPAGSEDHSAVGLRFQTIAAIVPDYEGGRPVAIPFGFELALASPQITFQTVLSDREFELIEGMRAKAGLSNLASDYIKLVRQWLDELYALGVIKENRIIHLSGDGSYTNGEVMCNLPDRVLYTGRLRRNAALFEPAEKPTKHRPYGKLIGPKPPPKKKANSDGNISLDQPTVVPKTRKSKDGSPLFMLKSDQYPEMTGSAFYGGKFRDIKYKDINNILWKETTRTLPVRVLIITPCKRYRGEDPLTGLLKRAFTEVSYLITTDLTTPAIFLIQCYFNRWQIEVAHREMKSDLGVGEYQGITKAGVTRFHASFAIFYGTLLLAWLKYCQDDNESVVMFPCYRENTLPMRPPIKRAVNILRQEIIVYNVFNTKRLIQYTGPILYKFPELFFAS